ncbi:ricin B lectin domain-containing protein [Mycena rosella]|uniref:Ricin B lectin domain-containing protein n=1 Tax=Mycena rosella TaxID=1033263 RepID=A0AAD7GRW7_MYCRO|nr:ricin B lectin domain-containing protein [Mycena rosella]
MILSTFIALSAFFLSATAVEIQSSNSAFFNAGIQGCISTADNEDGSPLVIHDCNTEDTANQDWQLSFFDKENAGPQPITIFGDKCIDVTGGVNADGTKLQIWTCSAGNTNQEWISVNDFTLQWAGTNKCIDLSGGTIADGTVLQIWTCTANDENQKWSGEPNPDTTETGLITGGDFSAGGGGPYCIAAASDVDGAEVTLVGCLNSDFHTTFPNGNITWLLPVAPLTGSLMTFNNKCLDVPNGSTANGVKLQIWTCAAGNTNQMFQNHNGQIEWSGMGKCLDLTDGESVNGNPIQLWDCAAPTTNPNQDWFISST